MERKVVTASNRKGRPRVFKAHQQEESELMRLLKRHRLARGMTQAEVAGKTDVSTAAYSSWETGRSTPRPKYIKRLSRVFDIPPFELTRIIVPDAATISHPGEPVGNH